jgi:hypothetical protein
MALGNLKPKLVYLKAALPRNQILYLIIQTQPAAKTYRKITESHAVQKGEDKQANLTIHAIVITIITPKPSKSIKL